MYVYIIKVSKKDNSFTSISQEGYKNLLSAQIFIENRSDQPQKCSEYRYESNELVYEIIDIKIV